MAQSQTADNSQDAREPQQRHGRVPNIDPSPFLPIASQCLSFEVLG